AACTKIDDTNLGSGLIPAVDNIHTFDTTVEVITTTYDLGDSTRTGIADDHIFGAINNNPNFGSENAVCYFELKPEYFGVSPFADTVVGGFDSVVLSISVKGFHGDSDATQIVQLRELDEPGLLKKYDTSQTGKTLDSNYLITNEIPTKPTILASANVTPKFLRDTTYIVYNNIITKVTNVIRLKLNSATIPNLFNHTDASYFNDDNTFRENVLRGFAVGVSPLSGTGFFKVDLNSVNTELQFYYRNNSADTVTKAFFFKPPSQHGRCGHAVYYHWDKSGSAYGSYTPTANPSGDSLVYIKTVPGTFAKIKIPALTGLSNRIVHRAELVATQVLPAPSYFMETPSILQLDAIDTLPLNKYLVIPHDFGIVANAPNIYYFGGYRPSYPYDAALNLYKYTFNLTGYVQGIVTHNERNYDLKLYAPYIARFDFPPGYYPAGYYPVYKYNDLGTGNVVLAGGTHSTYKMKLRIIYSKL
ncbi:MAG: DUF4270 family protein, partial [Bacteroidota bacterium]